MNRLPTSDEGYCLHGNKDIYTARVILSVKAICIYNSVQQLSIPYAPMLSLCNEPPGICDMMMLHTVEPL